MYPPIEITLYGKNDEVIGTYTRNVIPWGLLKKAISLQRQMEDKKQPDASKRFWEFWKKTPDTTAEEAQLTAISAFVVELFGNKFTVKQLEDGADIGEIMTVFRAVINRANASVKANPTPRPSSRK